MDVDLSNPHLRALEMGLSCSLLRLGGSPADFLVYDVFPGACSAGILNRTQPTGKGYFCPIWDQLARWRLTMDRWKALLQFAADAPLDAPVWLPPASAAFLVWERAGVQACT